MIFLRQSTAVDIGIGPFVDATDGVTAETGLTISQADVRLKKNNGAWAQVNDATSATHEENGWYEKELDATDTNTVGILLIAVAESGALPVWLEFQVLEEAVYDALFAASAAGYGTAQTGDSFARLGAPAGASVSADIAAIEAQTDDIGSAGAGLTALASAADLATVAGYLDTEIADIQARLPAALVGGRMDANVGAISGDATAADNLETSFDDTAGAVPWQFISHQGTLQSVTSTTVVVLAASASAEDDVYAGHQIHFVSATTGAKQSRNIESYVGATRTATLSAAVSVALTGTVVYKIAASAPDSGGGASAADVADAVWDELLSGHAVSGSAGEALSAAGTAGDPWTTALPGAYGSGTAGKIIGDNINATISSRATQTSVDTIDDFLDTEVAAIKAKTDNLPSDPADESLIIAATDAIVALIGTPAGASLAADIAVIESQTDDIGAAGAGLTALASQASVNTIDDFIDTEVAAILSAVDTEIGALATAVADLPTNAELATALGTADDAVLAAVATVDANVDSLLSGIIFGAAATGTLSTTDATTNLTGYGNDQLIGRVIIWLSGACEGEATDITDYVSTGGQLTFTALTTTPANGDLFKIV